MQSRPYKWFLKDVLPFIRFSTQLNKLRGSNYHEGYKLLRPGQIIACVDENKATAKLIPGLTSHAAICINKRSDQTTRVEVQNEIAEMTHTDFTYSDFFDICKESSRVFLLECLDWDEPYKNEVIDATLALHGSKYDSEFKLGVEALYCSELIYMADQIASHRYQGRSLKVDLSDLVGLGRPYLSPDGLLFAENIKCVWDSENEVTGKTGPQIEYVLTGRVLK